MFYKPLTRDNITSIIDLQMKDLSRRLADKQLSCRLTPEAKQFIIDAAYDPLYGARPLRRYLQHTVETLIAKKILTGDLPTGSVLEIRVEDDELTVVVVMEATVVE